MSTIIMPKTIINSTPAALQAVDATAFSGVGSNFQKVVDEWTRNTNTDFFIAKGKATNFNIDMGSPNTIGEAGQTTYNGIGSNLTGIASGGVGLPAIENFADAQKVSLTIPGNSIENAFFNGFIENSAGNYEVSTYGGIYPASGSFQFNTVAAGLNSYLVDRIFLSKAVAGATLQTSIEINNNNIYDVSAGVSTVQSQLVSTVDDSASLPSGTKGWFIKMIRTDLGGSTYTKYKPVPNSAVPVTLTAGTTFGANLLSLTHTALAGTLPAATTTVKYMFIYDNSALDYSLTSPLAAESYTSVPPSKLAVSSFAGPTVNYITDNFNRSTSSPDIGGGWTGQTYSSQGNYSCACDGSQARWGGCDNGSTNGEIQRSFYIANQNYSLATSNYGFHITGKLNTIRAAYGEEMTIGVFVNADTTNFQVQPNVATLPGVGAFFALDTATSGVTQGIHLRNGSNIQTTSFAFTLATQYSFRLIVTRSYMKCKVWLTSGSEPGAWTATYVYNFVNQATNNYLVLAGRCRSGQSGQWNYAIIDDLAVDRYQENSINVVYSQAGLTAAAGDKLAVRINNNRGIIGNNDKRIIKYAGMVV